MSEKDLVSKLIKLRDKGLLSDKKLRELKKINKNKNKNPHSPNVKLFKLSNGGLINFKGTF